MATLQSLQKSSNSLFSCRFSWQNAGLFNTASMSWSWKSFRASVLCFLLMRIMLCAKIHSSHQKEQHWKQYKVWALRLLQFPHFTLAVLHSFIAKTSSKLLIRKLVGSSLGFPLPGIWNCLLHSGHVILPWTPLVRWIPFRQWRQKLCKQGNCFGSVNGHLHTEQDTLSRSVSSKVFISMESGSETRLLGKNFGLVVDDQGNGFASEQWSLVLYSCDPYYYKNNTSIINQSNRVPWHLLMVWHKSFFLSFWELLIRFLCLVRST